MAAFHADHRRNLPGAMDPLYIVGGERELERVGVLPHHAMDDVDLLQRGGDGRLPLELHGNVDRPELAAYAASPQARDVGHDRWLRRADVEILEPPRRI